MKSLRAGLKFLGSIAVALAVLLLWRWVVEAELVSPIILPGPARVLTALTAQAESGQLLRAVIGTVTRMLQGFIVAAVLGVGLGLLIGLSTTARTYVEPTLEALRPLPATATIPVFIMLLGLTHTMIIAVIAFGSLWPIMLNTIQGLKTIEPRLIQLSRTLEMSYADFIYKIALPNAVPDIFAGLRIALVFSLILSVVTEMMSAEPGLGSTILLAARSFRSADLFAGIVALGMLGYVLNISLERTERYILRWRG